MNFTKSFLRSFYLIIFLLLWLCILTHATPNEFFLQITNNALSIGDIIDLFSFLFAFGLVLDLTYAVVHNSLSFGVENGITQVIRRSFHIMPKTETYTNGSTTPPTISDRTTFYIKWFGGPVYALAELKLWEAKNLEMASKDKGYPCGGVLLQFRMVTDELEKIIYPFNQGSVTE